MNLNEVCAFCPELAVRLLGTQGYCQECLDTFLEPLRQKVRQKYGDVRALIKHEASGWHLECQICGATWVGDEGEPCSWCLEGYQRLREQRRTDLLHPHWLRTSVGHPTYDLLDEVTQAVWNRTRGQTREPQSIQEWQKQIAQAEAEGFITHEEADRTLSRYGF